MTDQQTEQPEPFRPGTYRVQFERIGHTRGLKMFTAVRDGYELAHEVDRFARKFLGSREVDVTVLGRAAGEAADTGVVRVTVGGFRDAGGGTYERTGDLPPTPKRKPAKQ